MARTIQKGVARGVFSNESGLGSAPIAHAAAKTKEMAREGFVAMLGPFIDTILICTMTALVIIVTGAWQVEGPGGEILYGPGGKGVPIRMNYQGESIQVVGSCSEQATAFVDENGAPYRIPTGAALTAAAFELGVPGIGRYIVAFGLIFFAYSTMIAWSYYGDRCFEYLFGPRAVTPYRYIFCLFVILGTIGGLELVWLIADNLNALMAIPNLVGLLVLSGVVVRQSKDYLLRMQNAKDRSSL
jgi:AGCS family alanine or glycine:cation symporter